MTLDDPLAIQQRFRALFPSMNTMPYLNTAAEGLFGNVQQDALRRYGLKREQGSAVRAPAEDAAMHCKEMVAELIGVERQEIAFLSSTARGVDAVVQSIDWRAGDNIVVNDLEFPTNVLAALALQRRGVDVRVAQSRDGVLDVDTIIEMVNNRTRLVITSAVSFKTGLKLDVNDLAAGVHNRGSWLLVDGIQALGATPLDAREVDFLVAASYKWLLGAHGVGILYVNQRLHRTLAPSYVGWRSVVDAYAQDRLTRYTLHPDARCFEEGMPNYLGLYVLEASLRRILDIGVERIALHNESLVDRLMAGYAEFGIVPLTPTDRNRRASIVAIDEPHCAEIARQLSDQGVIVWGKDGRIRVAPHFYNNLADIERYLDVFARIYGFCGLRSIT